MNKTKIDWADSSWNPVTGCLHDCEYCYARSIATRFDGKADRRQYLQLEGLPDIYNLYGPLRNEKGNRMPYPMGFSPTFHRYRLAEYKEKKGRTIFVCSMADLFGDWVPDDWIEDVFEACEEAPQHRYLFLTKNPKRYHLLGIHGLLPKRDNFWYGSTVTTTGDPWFWSGEGHHTFASIEPILGPFDRAGLMEPEQTADWYIIGAMTGRNKDRARPKREWIETIVDFCDRHGKPILMKESLRDLMGEDFVQEYPWEMKGKSR